MKPNFTAWDFELKNMTESYHDNSIIITLNQTNHLFDCINVYSKGKVELNTDGVAREEDLEIIRKTIALRTVGN